MEEGVVGVGGVAERDRGEVVGEAGEGDDAFRPGEMGVRYGYVDGWVMRMAGFVRQGSGYTSHWRDHGMLGP